MRLSERRLCGLARLVRAERVDRAQRQNSLYGTEAVLDDPRFLAATAKPHPKPGTSSSKTRISDCPGFSLIRATFCSVSRISVGGSNLSERANKISRLTGPTLPRINRKKRAGQTRGRSSAGDRARDALTGHIRGKQITRRARSRLLRRNRPACGRDIRSRSGAPHHCDREVPQVQLGWTDNPSRTHRGFSESRSAKLLSWTHRGLPPCIWQLMRVAALRSCDIL
jgi:hypothetical protein